MKKIENSYIKYASNQKKKQFKSIWIKNILNII